MNCFTYRAELHVSLKCHRWEFVTAFTCFGTILKWTFTKRDISCTHAATQSNYCTVKILTITVNMCVYWLWLCVHLGIDKFRIINNDNNNKMCDSPSMYTHKYWINIENGRVSVSFRIMNKKTMRTWGETCLHREPLPAPPNELFINPRQSDKS